MMKTFVEIPSLGCICVRKMGHGVTAVIAFHGFAYDGQYFSKLAKKLSDTHTFYAVDLPFHGETVWSKDHYNASDIAQLIMAVVEANTLVEPMLIGHSLGGRFLLKVLGQELLSEQLVKKMILVAPDGLSGTYTGKYDYLPSFVINGLASVLLYRKVLLKCAAFLRRFRLIDKYAFSYINYHLKDEEHQKRLISSFQNIAAFKLREKEQLGLQRLAEIRILVGSQDIIININAIEAWFEPIQNSKVITFNGRHNLPVKLLAEQF